MNATTERMLRSLCSLDRAIKEEDVERAIKYLRGGEETTKGRAHILRYNEVMSLLGIPRATLDQLIFFGHLERAYVKGRKYALGIRKDSYKRFTLSRVFRGAGRNKAHVYLEPYDDITKTALPPISKTAAQKGVWHPPFLNTVKINRHEKN